MRKFMTLAVLVLVTLVACAQGQVQPILRIQKLANGNTRVMLGMHPMESWDLQASTNFVNWRTVYPTNNFGSPVREYFFTNNPPNQFFRAQFKGWRSSL